MELFQERAGVQPPLLAPIDGRFRTAVIQPISTEPEDVGSAMQAYQAAIRQVMISPSTKKDGGVPDNLSAGAATAFERATSVGDHGAQWVTLVRRTSNTTDLDLVGAMDAGRETSARWAAGQLVGVGEAQGTLGRRVPVRAGPRRRTSAARSAGRATRRSTPAPSARSGRPRSRRSTPPGAPTSPTPRAPRSSSAPSSGTLRARLDATLRGLDEWSKSATNDTLIDEATSIVERFAAGVNVEQLTENVVRALGVDLSLSDPTTNTIARALVLRHQDEVLDLWEKSDLAEPTRLAERLIEAIREDVERVFGHPGVYSGITEILREWAEQEEGSLSPDVRQFRTKMLTSITDSLVPPATDREIEAIVAIAYPGEQNSRVEARLAETLATHPSLSRFLQQASPTFVPRSADTALVISVALVGQGVMDVPDGAEGLNTWVESAFRPDPTDRLAWRQRDGYRDPIDFIDEDARAELLQRLLAAAWNGELTAERIPSNGQTGSFGTLTVQFGAKDAPQLHISLDNMPFANHLAPLADAYLREISQRYVSDTESVSEILRELSRTVPSGLRGAAPADERRAGRSAAVHRLRPRARSHGPRQRRARRAAAPARRAPSLPHRAVEADPPGGRVRRVLGAGAAGGALPVVRDAGLRVLRRGDRRDPDDAAPAGRRPAGARRRRRIAVPDRCVR